MKKIMKNRKKSVFPKFIKILMAGLMVFGVMQIPGQSINADNVVHAMDAEAKASFDGVTVKNGAKIFLGSQPATYVGNKTLLSDKTSAKVAGDNAGIETGSNAVWNSYYSKDKASAIGVLSQNGLPSIAEINLWKNDISSVGAGYWLSDAKTISVDDGSGLTTSTGKKYSFDTRAVAYEDNTMADAKRAISLSGEYLNETDKDNNGAKFDGRSIEIGNYSNISNINLSGFNAKKGYYKDLFAKQNSEIKSDFFMAWTGFDPNSTDNNIRKPKMYLNYNQDYDTLSDQVKSMTLDFYKKVELDANNKPVLNKEDRVTIQKTITYGDKVTRPMGVTGLQLIAGLLYDPIEETLVIPDVGKIYPKGTLLVYLYFDTSSGGHNGDPDKVTHHKTFLLDEDENTTESISGKKDVIVSESDYYGKYNMLYPTYDSYPFEMPNGVKILYAQAPIDFKILYTDGVNGVRALTRLTVTEGLRYYETDKTIPGTTLTGATNTVRPKMTLDTSKIKFARESGHGNTASSPNLGAMPTTTLDKDENYKLVLNNDSLNLDGSPIKKGTKITASGGTAAKGSVTQNNVITVTPGTTQITIPLVGNGGDKFSAISTKKDGSKAYGVVGSEYDGNVTINIDDLMDTKVGQSKTITLFNEKHNDARYSDEISTKGLEITVKVENPQTIDFTQTTKDLLLGTTFSDKDTFEVNAQVADKGIEALADTKTPITFTADSSYLVQVGTTKWDETSLIATATFKVVQSQKDGVTDDKYKITINRAGTDTNDPAPPAISTKVDTKMLTYNISYDLNAPSGETPINSPDNNKVTYTVEDIVTIKPPSLTGYTFTGWSERVTKGLDGADKDIVLPDEAGTVNDVDKTITINKGSIGHRKYTANWDVNKMKVDFDSDGGTSIESQNVDYKTTATYPEDTSRDGYVFDGWYKSIEGVMEEEQFDFATLITEDIVLKAKWVKMPYTIKYNVESEKGVNNPSNKKSYNIESPDITILDPSEKYGYIFSGWTYDGQEIPLKSPVISKGSFGDKAFTAVFTKEKYDVNFDLNGGTSSAIDIQNIEYQSKAISPLDPTRENHDFKGWYTEQIEDDAVNPDETKKWDFNTNTVTQSITLYARWELTTYTVTFDGDNGTTHPEYIKHGNTLSNNYTTTKPYYTFDAWYTRTENTEADYVYKQYDFNQPVTESFTLYAKWTKTPYTITYDKNHEDATGSTLSTIIHVGDTDKVYSSSGFLRDGYVFIGWNTERDGTGTAYKEGSPISTDAPASMKLYAQWIQEAKAFIEIPKTIQLSDGKKDTDDADKAIKTESIMIHLPTDSTMLLPDKDIIIRTKNGFPLTMTSSTSKYDVQVYKTTRQVDPSGGETQTDEIYGTPIVPGESPGMPSDALVTLNAKNENKKIGYFTLKTPKDGFKSKGIYTGIMTFHIQYESETQTTESK